MPKRFNFTIPSATTGEPLPTIALDSGDIVYVLGVNGSGKSSLVHHFYVSGESQGNAIRISAHRQTWFTSNTLDLTPRNRADLASNFKGNDTNPRARYFEWNAE